MSSIPLQQQPAEQTVDIPVGLQGLRPDRIQQHGFAEQNGGGLHDLPDPGGSSSSAVSRDEREEGCFRAFHRV